MKRSGLIQTQLKDVNTIQNLTSALEGVSSIRISQLKDKVLPGRECFDELWHTYSELRVDTKHQRFIAEDPKHLTNNKSLSVLITSEGNLGGLIDQKIVDYFMKEMEGKQTDIVSLGSHGATLLNQRGKVVTKAFPLPDLSDQATIQQVGQFIKDYAKITVFYQSYVSLDQQSVRTIDLISAVSTLGSESTLADNEVISTRDYTFEPSIEEIIKIMESTMLEIALREVILDSQLAQVASRFNAMLVAEDRAKKRRVLLFTAWHKAKRDESDKQLREGHSAGDML